MYNVMVAKVKNKPEEPFQGAEQEDKGRKTRRKDTNTRFRQADPGCPRRRAWRPWR